jgi:3-dehydrosphinganine reductase
VAAFAGRHAIITGGSSGIGRATAVRLAREGAHVAIIARDRTRLDEARDAIAAGRIAPDQRVAVFAADVADRKQVASAVAAAIGEIGPPDILMTSAGIAHCDYFGALPPEAFECAMATNYFGTLYAIHSALPAMERRRRGHLVLISSGAGLIGIHGYAAYSPTKFAVRGLGEALRAELGPRGIRVSIVYPPDTDTPQLEGERRTRPPETGMISSRAKTWSADGVARTIVLGIQRGAFTITPGIEMTLLARLHSIVAPGLNWYFDRLAARARQASRTPPKP